MKLTPTLERNEYLHLASCIHNEVIKCHSVAYCEIDGIYGEYTVKCKLDLREEDIISLIIYYNDSECEFRESIFKHLLFDIDVES